MSPEESGESIFMSKFIVSFYFVVFFYAQVQCSFMFDIFIAGQNSVKVLTGCGFVYNFLKTLRKVIFYLL